MSNREVKFDMSDMRDVSMILDALTNLTKSTTDILTSPEVTLTDSEGTVIGWAVYDPTFNEFVFKINIPEDELPF